MKREQERPISTRNRTQEYHLAVYERVCVGGGMIFNWESWLSG